MIRRSMPTRRAAPLHHAAARAAPRREHGAAGPAGAGLSPPESGVAPYRQGLPAVAHPAVVQRYAVPQADQPDLRVSGNAAVAVKGKKDLFATAAKLEDANLALAAAGTTGAYVQLEANGKTLAAYPALLGLGPTWVAARAQQPGTPKHHTDLSTENEDGDAYLSHADCHMTAQTVMGSSSSIAGHDDTERPVVGNQRLAPVTNKQLEDAALTGKTSTHVANRGLDAFYIHAMPLFAQTLLGQPGGAVTHAALIERIGLIPADASGIKRFANLYKDAIVPAPELLTLFSRTFGINEFAPARVGDAFVQVNDEVEKQDRDKFLDQHQLEHEAARLELTAAKTANEQRDKGGKGAGKRRRQALARLGAAERGVSAIPPELWNFHWAGVVMTDGPDHVTLENLSVELTSVKNDLWYFKMYGPGEQSFHAETKRTDTHVGANAITLPFRAAPAPPVAPVVKTNAMAERIRRLQEQKSGVTS